MSSKVANAIVSGFLLALIGFCGAGVVFLLATSPWYVTPIFLGILCLIFLLSWALAESDFS